MRTLLGAILLLSLLAGCALDPVKDNAKAIRAAEKAGVPLLIYSRRSLGELGFINVSDYPIKFIELKVDLCGIRGEMSSDAQQPYWAAVLFMGPFAGGRAYKVKRAKVVFMDAQNHVFKPKDDSFGWTGKLVGADVQFLGGTPAQVYSDMSRIVLPQVKNACPAQFFAPWRG